MLVLFENAAGLALLKVLDEKKLKDVESLQECWVELPPLLVREGGLASDGDDLLTEIAGGSACVHVEILVHAGDDDRQQ